MSCPALTGKAWKSTLKANATANLVRNLWTNAVIFCGRFPDGAEKFTKTDVDNGTHAQWYLRQMLGSANISGGPVMDFMTGNLSYQIEHHVFPDLLSNCYHEISIRVKQLCEKYDLPYTTGPLAVQYWKSWRTIAKLSLPDKYLTDTRDAPETASEAGFGGPRHRSAHRSPYRPGDDDREEAQTRCRPPNPRNALTINVGAGPPGEHRRTQSLWRRPGVGRWREFRGHAR